MVVIFNLTVLGMRRCASFVVAARYRKGKNYGYGIIQLVHESSNERIKWSDGMLYPVLHRLEKKGLIESEWCISDSGRRRKYYSLKNDGAKALKKNKEQWDTVNTTLSKIWAV